MNPFNRGAVTNVSVGLLNGVWIEITEYTNSKGAVTNSTRAVSKEQYATEIAQINKTIETLQASIASKQNLSDEIAA